MLLNEFCLFRFLYMVDVVFNFRSELETWRDFLRNWFRNANQWCPITSWLGRFNPKTSWAWVGAGCGGPSPSWTKPSWIGWFRGWSSPSMKKFMNSSKSQVNSLRKSSPKSTMYQELAITQKTLDTKNLFQNIADLVWRIFLAKRLNFEQLC